LQNAGTAQDAPILTVKPGANDPYIRKTYTQQIFVAPAFGKVLWRINASIQLDKRPSARQTPQ